MAGGECPLRHSLLAFPLTERIPPGRVGSLEKCRSIFAAVLRVTKDLPSVGEGASDERRRGPLTDQPD